LLGGLRITDQQLLGTQWFRGRPSTLHKAHQEISIVVDDWRRFMVRELLVVAATAQTHAVRTLSKEFLQQGLLWPRSWRM
jgi:hypothetical protein